MQDKAIRTRSNALHFPTFTSEIFKVLQLWMLPNHRKARTDEQGSTGLA